MGRFINADDPGYMGIDGTPVSYNLFAYCGNNPVCRCDSTGYAFDTVLDIAFICWDVINLFVDKGYKDWGNWAALGLDITFAAIPFATGGGKTIKLANVGDDLHDFSKVTVVGETMTRVQTVAQFVNAADNLYGGFSAYKKLSSIGKVGRVLAEIGGKATNIAWLYGKLRRGYTIIDIGIDVGRTVRSSSYFVEKTVLGFWKWRNFWKQLYHIDN